MWLKIIIILAGLWSTVGLGILQIGKSRPKMQRTIRLFGEGGARIVYIITGIILVILGITVDFLAL
jgi:hypothetical protein